MGQQLDNSGSRDHTYIVVRVVSVKSFPKAPNQFLIAYNSSKTKKYSTTLIPQFHIWDRGDNYIVLQKWLAEKHGITRRYLDPTKQQQNNKD